jgi:hypothetical protein
LNISVAAPAAQLRPFGDLDREVATNRSREVALDLGVPRNRLATSRLRIVPDGVIGSFAQQLASVLLQMSERIPTFHVRSNCERNFSRSRVLLQSCFTFNRQKISYGSGQILETFRLRRALPIGPRHLQARGPEASLVRISAMNDGGELAHA